MQNFRFFLLRKNSLILLLTCCKKFGSHNSSKWYQNKRPRYRMIQVRSLMVDIHLTIELVRRILETSIPNNTAALWRFTLKITGQLWYHTWSLQHYSPSGISRANVRSSKCSWSTTMRLQRMDWSYQEKYCRKSIKVDGKKYWCLLCLPQIF